MSAYLFGTLAFVILAVIFRRRVSRKSERVDEADRVCLRCGYSLQGLEIPRCPECGTLSGFRVPLEQLGLTDEEIRQGYERRNREKNHRSDGK